MAIVKIALIIQKVYMLVQRQAEKTQRVEHDYSCRSICNNSVGELVLVQEGQGHT